ncbi:hypothetical protein WJX72_002447 [[Myrmecia] bisecta]|uniref:Uncharacterized protein n=1 Tax=[Myrmecia] bisecta TaxID=41462 RepID=A0AAW1R526_9CHLO
MRVRDDHREYTGFEVEAAGGVANTVCMFAELMYEMHQPERIDVWWLHEAEWESLEQWKPAHGRRTPTLDRVTDVPPSLQADAQESVEAAMEEMRRRYAANQPIPLVFEALLDGTSVEVV